MPQILRLLLLVVVAIVLLYLAIKVVANAIGLIFWGLAILLIGYVALRLIRGAR